MQFSVEMQLFACYHIFSFPAIYIYIRHFGNFKTKTRIEEKCLNYVWCFKIFTFIANGHGDTKTQWYQHLSQWLSAVDTFFVPVAVLLHCLELFLKCFHCHCVV